MIRGKSPTRSEAASTLLTGTYQRRPRSRKDSHGPITVQVIEGRIRFSAESQTVTLTEGHMLSLQAGLPHAVEASEESAFLLTVAPTSL